MKYKKAKLPLANLFKTENERDWFVIYCFFCGHRQEIVVGCSHPFPSAYFNSPIACLSCKKNSLYRPYYGPLRKRKKPASSQLSLFEEPE